ncbi:protein wings apart-like [Aricia agestis]|uniref:protein wings apart-like n=1 Tax=Aricia agestis TaxID=91739 RepID=UPI001C206CE5|nr:protein wings apart-like [Aricia agestis]
MSRWGRGRSGSVAVPLDSALFRENSNCPSAARSAGTVGKWGITSFTSIRSAPYAYQASAHKKPVQDQNSPLTVPAVETEQPPPKPKKFFKSRNAEPYPPVPQIIYAPPVPAAPLSPEHHSSTKEKKTNKRSRYNRDSSSPELPRRSFDKSKTKKGVATKASKKEEGQDNSQPPNKRYLVRNRDKVINYAEDGSNSPIPEFTRYESLPKSSSPKASPLVSSPAPAKTDIASPSTSKEKEKKEEIKENSEEKKPPPIVLRISKGTSRIVSTDSNEGFTSPGSDRHSSMDTHSDYGTLDHKKSPSVETICSPKHEGLKITIKCAGLLQETKKEKKKDKKDHKSHKRHHKNNDEENHKKAASPQPGSDAYDLYKTLASPMQETEKDPKSKLVDNIESELATLDSTTSISRTPESEKQSIEPQPEPKPPEGGRSRRNRPNINYRENDDDLDSVVKGLTSSKYTKTVGEIKRETRRTRKKQDAPVDTPSLASASSPRVEPEVENQPESLEHNDLIDILSGDAEKEKPEPLQKLKLPKKLKVKHNKSPPTDKVPENIESNEQAANIEHQNSEPIDTVQTQDVNEAQLQTQSSDSAYNSCPNELSEEESQKCQQEEVFKSPRGLDAEETSEEKPSVKLVITKKKGSIFKSKSLVNDNQSSPLPARKRRHLYRHEWANDKGNETPRPEQTGTPETGNAVTQNSEELTRVTRFRPDPIIADPISEPVKPYTSVRCNKEVKEFYTVVRNVKKAHQIQEIGEFQEFNDDVEYLLDACQDNNPISTRCLSAITLASKCTAPAFRMHLRAHGTVQKFFSALHDATNDQSLGLCTATVMFVLSQDRLNMDLDRESLELMLNLLESDVSHKNALDDCGLTSAQLTKTQERVRELCAEIKSQGNTNHLDLDNITVGHLAMETLLSLTSKRAGEWFKEELRNLGGVDHIVRTIQDCAARLESPAAEWGSAQLDVLRKADRCMRVLENVTQQNEANQQHLVSGSLGAATTLCDLLRRCITEARVTTADVTLHDALLHAALPALKVLVNLSHCFSPNSSALGAQVVGEQPSIMEICLIVLNNQENFIPDNLNFDFNVCVLMLLMNLVQNNEVNTQRLLGTRIRVDSARDVISRSVAALDLIVDLFYTREELARKVEENTDALLDGKKDEDSEKGEKDNKKQSQDDIDETVTKLLARAGAHMEHTMVGAYVALVLGQAAVAVGVDALRPRLPAFAPLLPTLRKYYNFLSLTASAEAGIVAHVKSTQRIIQFMEASDKENAAHVPAAPYSADSYAARYEAPHAPPTARYEATPTARYEAPSTARYEAPHARYEAPHASRYEAPHAARYEAPLARYEAPPALDVPQDMSLAHLASPMHPAHAHLHPYH